MKLNEQQLALKEKWDKKLRAKFQEHQRYHGATATELAFATVHWHHNIEMDARHDEPDKSTYFTREYSRMATEMWLWEIMQRIAAGSPAGRDPVFTSEDDEMSANNLRVALESYEINDHTA